MGMEETAFYTYVSKLLQETGHMTQAAPIYANCSIQTALFIENERPVTLSDTDCATLSCVSHVSLLTELTWSEGTEKVQLYAVTTDFSKAHRSQDIAETHRLLQGAWRNRHSIVFFQNADAWAVSFADDRSSHVLSDWFSFADEDTAVSARLSIENISLTDSTAYFQDFQYAMAREYYVHPISRSAARYALLPRDLQKTQYDDEADILTEPCISQEEFRSMVHENICYYENIYGDDYVASCNPQTDTEEAERKAKEEAERQAEIEQQARATAVVQLATVLRNVIAKAERQAKEEAERQAEIERQAKETAIRQLATVLRNVIAKAERKAKEEAERQAEIERQAKETAVVQLATVLRNVIAKAERQAREEAERQAAIERQARATAVVQLAIALRNIIAKAERVAQLTRQHDETVSQLQRRYRSEMELVQAELVSLSARISQVEQTMARLHILQFKKKKALMAERDELLQKNKKLQLLLAKIEDSLEKQLAREDIAHATALAALQQ